MRGHVIVWFCCAWLSVVSIHRPPSFGLSSGEQSPANGSSDIYLVDNHESIANSSIKLILEDVPISQHKATAEFLLTSRSAK